MISVRIPDMEKLVTVIRTIPVQAVLLTATMPPSMQPDLRIALACVVWEVVRAETRRREIEYEMVEVNEEEDTLDVEIAFRIKKEMRKWSRDRNGDTREGSVIIFRKIGLKIYVL